MSVFRKILSTANKTKGIKLSESRPNNKEFEEKELEETRLEWQKELEDMSDFLIIKPSQEADSDTAFIDDDNGLPVFKAVFDVNSFDKKDITLRIEGDKLHLEAKHREEKDDRAFVKTMLRTLDLPSHVDDKLMRTSVNDKGFLIIEMPFHLPPSRSIQQNKPGVHPVITDPDGTRKIRLCTVLGREFTPDDINVFIDEKDPGIIAIRASYEEGAGEYGDKHRILRNIKKDIRLPSHMKAKSVKASLGPTGNLYIEIILLDQDKTYRCSITSEDVTDEVSDT